MDEDAGTSRRSRTATRFSVIRTCMLVIALMTASMAFTGLNRNSTALPVVGIGAAQPLETAADAGTTELPAEETVHADSFAELFPVHIVGIILLLIGCSAFFSGSEAAFFSIHKIRLRGMRSADSAVDRAISSIMEHPGRLLTTILMANMIANVLIGVFLGTRVESAFRLIDDLHQSAAFAAAVVTTTVILVLFGEILPKILAVRTSILFARIAVFPLFGLDWLLAPLRDAMIWITKSLLTLTRISSGPVAPFITDEEFMAVLEEGETHGVIEEDERQMIEGILEASDAMLREILIPRTDVVAVHEDASVADALTVLREHQFSRMPVYSEDLDKVTGLLVIKDLLPAFAQGKLDRQVKDLARPILFVPETLTVQQFVREAQRKRAHLAVVVDEYGGTAGVVALEDALELIVGDIFDEDEIEEPEFVEIQSGVYRVSGQIAIDTVNELLKVDLRDEEHETIAGYLMEQAEKIPEPGDVIIAGGVRFTVEECDGRRASLVRVEAAPVHDLVENEVKGNVE